jgi:VanZ family protein
MHGLLYFSAYLFTFLIVSPYTNKKAVIVGLIWFSVGFLEEVRQSFTHRGFSILDIISNFVGIIVSYYLLKLFYDSRKKANNLSVS